MKMLAVSLLRLGDILMLAPVLKGIKEKNPEVELHVLVNKQFLFVQTLMPWVDKFIALDRKELQRGIGEIDRNILEPLNRLDATIDYLNRQNYKKIFNLSHSKFSGYICGMLKCEDKLGLSISPSGHVKLGNPWYSYLNEQVAGGNPLTAHMLDIHYYGSNLPYTPHEFDFRTTEEGEFEADSILSESDNFICVQLLTSDKKKNWEFDKIKDTLKFFKLTNKNVDIFILGAPNESDQVGDFVKLCLSENLKVIPAICSLSGALSILYRSRLLLTGDTSIKHLAGATDCKILELCIGSSDYQKTGIYKSNSYIVTSKVGCAPCVHSEKCSQRAHLCGEEIQAEGVGALMHQILNGTLHEVKIIASEYADSFRVLKTYFSHSGFWHVRDLSVNFSSQDLGSVINLSSWKLLNQGEHLKLIGAYGSESIKLNAAIQQAYPETKAKVKKRFFNDLEEATVRNGEKLLKLRKVLQEMVKNKGDQYSEVERNYNLLSDELSPKFASEILDFCKSYKGDPQNNFTKLRKYSDVMNSAFHRNQIQLKLIRTMINQRTDNL